MRRGLSWDGAPKRTIAALVLAVMMAIPGAALAAPTQAPVGTASIGHVHTALEGVSWSRRPDVRAGHVLFAKRVTTGADVYDDYGSYARGVSWS